MKDIISKTVALSLLLAQSKCQKTVPLPDLTGTAVTPTNATSSCYQCIRGGWIWCSDKWTYQSPSPATTYNPSLEKGKCCFNSSLASKSRADNTLANVIVCPAQYSNASGATIVENSASAFWCSDSATYMEYALI